MQTAFTQKFGIQWPIVQAGMGGQAGPELAAAVSEAGALGTLGTVATPPKYIREAIEKMRGLTGRPFSVNLAAYSEIPYSAELIDLAAEMRVPSATLSFDVAPEQVEKLQAAGVPVIVQVQRAAQVRRVLPARPAAFIAQGGEAGGHTGSRGLFSFLCEVLDLAGDIPVIAAGGIADGRGLAGALAMGAAGVVMGTRFKATPEFAAADTDKQAIVSATGDDTVRDPIVDVPVPFPWPEDNFGRLLANQFTKEWLGREADLRKVADEKGAMTLYGELSADPQRSLNWAGESSALVHEIRPAAEVVRRTVAEAEARLKQLGGLLQPVG